MTLNLWNHNKAFTFEDDSLIRNQAMYASLISIGADIYCLQEVRPDSIFEKFVKNLGYDLYFSKNLQGKGWTFGNAIITNLPVKSHRSIKINKLRSFQILEFDGFAVINCHLSKSSNHMQRVLMQARNLLTPAILVGDFNMRVGSHGVEMLLDAGYRFTGGSDPVLGFKSSRIDFIFYKNTEISVIKNGSFHLNEEITDHPGYVNWIKVK